VLQGFVRWGAIQINVPLPLHFNHNNNNNMLQSVQGAPAERREATEQRVEDNA